MIKFRQKEYSTRKMKLLKGVKKAVNQADTAISNSSLKLQGKLGLTGKGPASRVIISPKTDAQLSRETIKTVRGIERTGKKIIETPLNEGLDKGLGYVSGNPITFITSAAPIPGSTALGLAGEKALKTKLPGYGRVTRRLQEGYTKSPVSKGLRKMRMPSIGEITQMI